MIVITVEMWPRGEKERAEPMGSMTITNDATGTRASGNYWKQPLAWNRKAAAEGEVKLVFCSSMADVADVFEDHPTVDQERPRLWDLIKATPWLTWLLLTKRPQNIKAMYPARWLRDPPHNVWPGASGGNQKWATRRFDELVKVKAPLLFASCEPLIGPLDITRWLVPGGLGWVISGGESASLKKARPMHPAWPALLRDQCRAAGVPYFLKQLGSWLPVATPRVGHGEMLTMNSTGKVFSRPASWNEVMETTGDVWGFEHYQSKHQTGRSLDGVEHSEIPTPMKPVQQRLLL